MFGYSQDALLGQFVESLVPKRFRTRHVQDRANWFAQPRSRPMGIGLELAGLRKDGSEFPIEVSLSSISADGGTLGVAFVSDITERKKSEEDLAESKNQLSREVAALDQLRKTTERLWQSHDLRAGLATMLDAGIALLGADFGNIRLFNRERKVLEIVAQRGFAPDFLDHFRELSAADGTTWGRSLRTGERVIVEDVTTDAEYALHRAAAAAAGYRAIQSTPLLTSDGKPIGMFSTHFRKPHRPSEQELSRFDLYAYQAAQFIERLRVEEQLQRLTGELFSMQEQRNREVARELHDVFSQELVGVGMEIALLKQAVKSDVDLTGRVSEIESKIASLREGLHRTSRVLHPAILEDLGLEAALRQECDLFQKTSGIQTEFTAKQVPAEIPQDVALCLYRVIQECLRNISKHAPDTDRVRTSLTGGAEGITVIVEDNGDGFELNEALRKGGLGLISMEERIRLVKGKLTIQSQIGKGTTVTAFVPLSGRGR